MVEGIILKRRNNRELVQLKDIVFMEKDRRIINVYTVDGIMPVYGRYEEFETKLDDRFISPHRSYIINMDYITAIEENQIKMASGHVIHLCTKCMIRLKKVYDEYTAKHLANRRAL